LASTRSAALARQRVETVVRVFGSRLAARER
jgi:hypothetical protein